MKFLSPINVNTEYTLPFVDGTNGQVLTTDGNGAVYWGSVSAGATNLNALTDVELTTPTSGQILRYELPPGGEIPIWRNVTPNYLTPNSSINALGDVTIASAVAGQILQFNGTFWINTTLSTVEYVSKVQHTVKAGVAITKGQAVYVTTSDGTNMIAGLASNAAESTSSKVIGLAAANAAINDQIFVVTEGLIAGLDTSTATAGDPVWLGTNGNLIFGLANKPVAPAHLVYIGVVTRVQSNNGEIFVNVQNGFELNELHDALIVSPTAGQLLRRDSDNLWKNWTPNYLTAHPSIQNTGSVNNSLGTVVQDITLDANGHVTTIGSVNLDNRYYTQDDIAALFGGDTAIAGYNLINWDAAYADKINSASFSTTTGVLTLTQQDAGTVTVDLDGRYLQSFTETDPTVPAHVKSITATNISNWNDAFNDSIRSAAFNKANGVLTLTQVDLGTVTVDLDGRYLETFTETDPTVPVYVKAITETQIGDWDRAYNWGNHADAGYAPVASPSFTGTPLAPTAAAGTNTTQIATTAFVQTAVSNLVDAAPATLDTLNELAAALGDDPNFATTVTNSIATKVPTTRTLTINGTAFDLSADRSWTIDSADGYISDVRLTESSLDFTGEGSAFNGSVDLSTLPFQPAGSYLTAEADTLQSVTTRGSSTTTVLSTNGGNIVLRADSIENHVTNGNAAIVFNYYGYATGFTQFRDTIFYNGKGSAVMFVDGSSSNVGIGTTSPGAPLHVYKNDTYSAIISRADWNSGTSTKLALGKQYGVLGFISSDLVETTNDTSYIALNYKSGLTTYAEGLRVYNNGSVGIGTTAPVDQLAIGASSSVAGFSVGSGLTQVFLRYNNYFNVSNQVSDATKGTATIGIGRSSDGVVTFWTAAAGAGAPVERMRITNAGNVGIGTTSPSTPLEIAHSNGNAFIVRTNDSTAANNAGFILANVASATQSSRRSVFVMDANGANGSGVDYTYFDVYGNGVTSIVNAKSDGILAFGTADTERMRITSAGNVGIGTTSPNSKLVIARDVTDNDLSQFGYVQLKLIGSTASAKQLLLGFETENNYGFIQTLQDGASWTAYNLALQWKGGNVGIGTKSPVVKTHIVGPTLGTTSETTYPLWLSDTGDTTKALILGFDLANDVGVIQAVDQAVAWKSVSLAPSGGNVGIGKTTPSTKLDVNGVITATGGNSTNWNSAYGWGNHATAGYFKLEGTEPITIQAETVTFTGSVTIEGTLTESSSFRFKENIEPLPQSLEAVNALNPVSYNKIGEDNREIGLIAEEVAELFPEVVTYNEQGQPQGIQYQRLSVILLKAVQELSQEVNELKKKLN